MSKCSRALLGAAAAVGVFGAMPAQALTIVLNDIGGVNSNAAAFAGFTAAAKFWEKMLINDVSVKIDVGFSATGFSSANVIGSTASLQVFNVSAAATLDSIAATGRSRLDAIAAANRPMLSAAGALSVITQQAKADGTGVLQNVKTGTVETTSNREFDTDGSRNNTELRYNTAAFKAIGGTLAGLTQADATVRFNSAFSFDFDPTDGVGVGQIDFVGTAIHELGHALGFTSGVDTYDANSNSLANFDNRSNNSTLDLFRYSADTGNLAPGSDAVLDWSVGGQGANRPYFSIDGGATNGLMAFGGSEGNFSTGRNFGDLNQASHWQDTPYTIAPGDQGTGGLRCLRPIVPSRGVMDPTAAPCEESIITMLDLAAFDAMGWNLSFDVLASPDKVFTSARALTGLGAVPEPATWVQLILGFGLLGAAARRLRSAGRTPATA